MNKSNQFTIHRKNDITSQISSEDGSNYLTVAGRKIEVEYALSGDRHLLIMTDDNPFEEELHIHLIDNGKLVDTLSISPPYQSMIIDDVSIVDSQTLGLHINEKLFHLHVNATPLSLIKKIKATLKGHQVGKSGMVLFHAK